MLRFCRSQSKAVRTNSRRGADASAESGAFTFREAGEVPPSELRIARSVARNLRDAKRNLRFICGGIKLPMGRRSAWTYVIRSDCCIAMTGSRSSDSRLARWRQKPWMRRDLRLAAKRHWTRSVTPASGETRPPGPHSERRRPAGASLCRHLELCSRQPHPSASSRPPPRPAQPAADRWRRSFAHSRARRGTPWGRAG